MGRLLASGSDDLTVRIWNASTGSEIHQLTGHGGHIQGVAFSPDGKWLASASKDKTVKLWEVRSGREARTFTGRGDAVFTLAFSGDGRWIVSGSDDKNGQAVESCHGPTCKNSHWSADKG